MTETIYLIYQTTNLVNGKTYIGQHKTTNINDGYLGSGQNIRRAIKKYGKSNFKREVLFIFDNFNDMNDKEAELVNEEFVAIDTNYNLVCGGGYTLSEWQSKVKRERCSNGNKGRKLTQEHKDAISRSTIGVLKSEETKAKMSFKTAEHIEKLSLGRKLYNQQGHSESTKAKISRSHQNRVKIQCEYCHNEFSKTNYIRWHGEKCKLYIPQETSQ